MLRKKRGQSIVEWAIILPFFLLVLISIVELSPLINTFLKAEKGSQYAARTGAVHGASNQDILKSLGLSMQGLMDVTQFQGPVTFQDTQHGSETSAYSEYYSNGNLRSYVEIVPGKVEDRINGSWIMVKVQYRYPLYTPLIKTLLDVGGYLKDGTYFEIVRYAIYRVE